MEFEMLYRDMGSKLPLTSVVKMSSVFRTRLKKNVTEVHVIVLDIEKRKILLLATM